MDSHLIFLYHIFPGHWIGRDVPIPWPPRSPDNKPLHLGRGGYVKERALLKTGHDVEELKTRLWVVVEDITPATLRSTWREIEFTFISCAQTIKSIWKLFSSIIFCNKVRLKFAIQINSSQFLMLNGCLTV